MAYLLLTVESFDGILNESIRVAGMESGNMIQNSQGFGEERMRRVKVRILGAGFHPNELLVAVVTADGSEEQLVVDKRSVMEESISIGYPVDRSESGFLVELPRESIRGIWRIWVPQNSLIEESIA